MTNSFLTDPDNAKAYQTLCDCPSGSIRSWAAKAGWTRSRMERFILRLRALGLARIDASLEGSTFVPLGVSDASRTRLGQYLGSKELDKPQVSRYGESPERGKVVAPIADPDDVRLIATANEILVGRGWPKIDLASYGSIAGAKKILKVVPIDRAVPLLEAAVRLFNPSATGGEQLRSLGHPFITRYVVNEFRRTERDLAQGQLTMLFVERTSPSAPAFGSKTLPKEPEASPATPEAIAAGREEFLRIASSRQPPPRRQ